MARKLITVLKQKEIKRLYDKQVPIRAIARAMKCSRNTVKKYLSNQVISPKNTVPLWCDQIDWNDIDNQHSIKGVPLQVLWEEMFEQQKLDVQYPAFWKQFHRRYPNIARTMVRHFNPGDRIEIDYGDGIEMINPSTGEIIKTQFFVGVLCCSRYTFAEFTLTQKSVDFLSSHVRMFEYFGGLAHTLTPDNLKSAVTKAHRYDPDINPAYTKLAEYYNVAVTPARVRTPKDKPIVERTIQIFQKWFYFRVRHRTFTSLVELNKCLQEHLELFHDKKHRILGKTRREMFEEEKKHLLPLPADPYLVRTHKQAKLHSDCHLQFDSNYYSAPWTSRGRKLDVWATDKVVEIYDGIDRVAIHNRNRGKSKFVTNKKHYPPEHQAYLEITPTELRKRAQKMGPKIFEVIDGLLNCSTPLRHLRRAQGILALNKKYNYEQLNAACTQALIYEKINAPFIERLAKNYKVKTVETTVIKRSSNPHLRGDELYQ